MKANFIRFAVFATFLAVAVLFAGCAPLSEDSGVGSDNNFIGGGGNLGGEGNSGGGSPTSIESWIPGTYLGNGYTLLFSSDKTGNITGGSSGNMRSASSATLQTGEFIWGVSNTTVTIKMKDDSAEYRATYSTGKLTIDGNDYKADISAPANLAEWRALSESQISSLAASLPTFDSRKYGVVPKVTDQGSGSLCWVYGSISAASVSALKDGFNTSWTKDNLEFSEENIAWRVVNKTTNRLPGLNPETFTSANYDKGRGEANVLNIFTQWYGPVEKKDLTKNGFMTFKDSSDDVKVPLLEEAGHLPPLKKGDEKLLKTYKEYVLKYGALSIGHAYSASISNVYWNNDGSKNQDHGVAIVGWDDSISKYNFSKTASRDGAWLIRDSWGPGAHNGGYFWLSYDSTVYGGVYFDFTNMKYDYNYYYDSDATGIASFKVRNGQVKAANIYRAAMGTTKKQEVLSAVNIALGNSKGDPTTTNISVEIEIYKGLKEINPGNLKDPRNIPVQGNPAVRISKFYPFAGYYTVELPEPLPLEKNEWFSIVVTVKNPQGDASVRYSKEPSSSTNDLSYYYDGTRWVNSKEGDGVDAVARIKAYTNLVDRQEALKDHLKNANIFVDAASFIYDGSEKTPKVTVMFDGKTLVENSDYTLAYANNVLPGEARIFVAGKGKYEGQVVEKNFTISKCDYPFAGEPYYQMRYSIHRSDATYVKEIPLPYGWTFDNPNKLIGELPLERENGIPITYKGFDADCYKNLNANIWVTVQGEKRENSGAELRNVSLEKKSYIFNNSPVRPKVTVNVYDGWSSYQGDEGWQYCVTYENNDKPGKATVIVKGINTYFGKELRIQFDIVKNEKTSLATAVLSYQQDGHEFVSDPIKPEVKVILGGRTLQKDVDYLLAYENNDVGGKGSIVVIGINGYEGAVTGTFNIIDKSAPSTATSAEVQIDDDATANPTKPLA